MRKLLERFKEENKVVSICSDPSDTNTCWTGFVVDVDDNHVLLAHITSNGFYEGFVLISTEDVLYVEEGNKYEKRLHKLYELRKQSHPNVVLNSDVDLLEGILQFCKDEGKVLSIELVEDDDYDPAGFVHEICEDYVCLEKLTNDGERNGFAYVKMENIHKIFVDGLNEQNISLLYDDLNK